MGRSSIEVPDVVGLAFASAYSIGTAAGLVVVGRRPDGSAVAPTDEGRVVEQDPPATGTTKSGRHLALRVGRGDGGAKDPEPRRPDPLVHTDRGEPDDRGAADEERVLLPV